MNIQFYKPLLLAFLLIGNVRAELPSGGMSVTYEKPQDWCIRQGQWSGDIHNFSINHTLVVLPEHLGKNGKTFVGFRHDRTPSNILDTELDEWWYFGGVLGSWGKKPAPNNVFGFWEGQASPLRPLESVGATGDMSKLNGKGELLVGYGLVPKILDNSDRTGVAGAFAEMLANKRYSIIVTFEKGNFRINRGNSICFEYKKLTVD